MLSIIGVGLVSPVGARASDHVFFTRAGMPGPWPSPYLGSDDRAIDANICPWIEPLEDAGVRMRALAETAIDEALAGHTYDDVELCLCVPENRPTLTDAMLTRMADALAQRAGATRVRRATGAAAAFWLLQELAASQTLDGSRVALLVAVDSLVSFDGIARHAKRPPSRWLLQPLAPAEGAAALLLASPALAQSRGVDPLLEIVAVRSKSGAAHDDNDAATDGSALTEVIRALVAADPIGHAFGQARVDALRAREWSFAVARAHACFADRCHEHGIEASIGQLGAAAGAFQLAHAAVMTRHGALLGDAPMLAWAISRDGLRGAAVTLRGPARSVPVTLDPAALRARTVPRDRFEPPVMAGDDDDEAWLTSPEAESGAQNDGSLAPRLRELALSSPEISEKAQPRPKARVERKRRRLLSLATIDEKVVRSCLELIAALLRDRRERALRDLAGIEARIARQMDAIIGAGSRAAMHAVERWPALAVDTYGAAACALAVAAFDGDDTVDALVWGCERTPPLNLEPLVEALRLCQRSNPERLTDALLTRTTSVRAAGLALAPAADRRVIADDAELLCAIGDQCDAVATSAMRAADMTLAASDVALRERMLAAVRQRAERASPFVTWRACRLRAVWRDPSVADELADGALVDRLGPYALPLAALCLDETRLGLVEKLARWAKAPIEVAAIGRYGHPKLAEDLLEKLAQEETTESAARALATIFGDVVDRRRTHDAAEWREAIARHRFDAYARLRRGQLRSDDALLDDLDSRRARVELDPVIDELRARHDLPAVDLSGPSALSLPAFEDWVVRARERIAKEK
jgi:hypothetical protein